MRSSSSLARFRDEWVVSRKWWQRKRQRAIEAQKRWVFEWVMHERRTARSQAAHDSENGFHLTQDTSESAGKLSVGTVVARSIPSSSLAIFHLITPSSSFINHKVILKLLGIPIDGSVRLTLVERYPRRH
jgi:hypothetical protein